MPSSFMYTYTSPQLNGLHGAVSFCKEVPFGDFKRSPRGMTWPFQAPERQQHDSASTVSLWTTQHEAANPRHSQSLQALVCELCPRDACAASAHESMRRLTAGPAGQSVCGDSCCDGCCKYFYGGLNCGAPPGGPRLVATSILEPGEGLH